MEDSHCFLNMLKCWLYLILCPFLAHQIIPDRINMAYRLCLSNELFVLLKTRLNNKIIIVYAEKPKKVLFGLIGFPYDEFNIFI